MKGYKPGVTKKDVVAHQKENVRLRIHEAATGARSKALGKKMGESKKLRNKSDRGEFDYPGYRGRTAWRTKESQRESERIMNKH